MTGKKHSIIAIFLLLLFSLQLVGHAVVPHHHHTGLTANTTVLHACAAHEHYLSHCHHQHSCDCCCVTAIEHDNIKVVLSWQPACIATPDHFTVIETIFLENRFFEYADPDLLPWPEKNAAGRGPPMSA